MMMIMMMIKVHSSSGKKRGQGGMLRWAFPKKRGSVEASDGDTLQSFVWGGSV